MKYLHHGIQEQCHWPQPNCSQVFFFISTSLSLLHLPTYLQHNRCSMEVHKHHHHLAPIQHLGWYAFTQLTLLLLLKALLDQEDTHCIYNAQSWSKTVALTHILLNNHLPQQPTLYGYMPISNKTDKTVTSFEVSWVTPGTDISKKTSTARLTSQRNV